jgi:energy-coupling factor transport system permease protein
MTILAPLAPDSAGRLARRDPVAKIGMAVVVMGGLVVSGDIVTPALVLAVELAVLPLAGVRAGTLARRAWPLLLGVAGVALTNVLVVDGGSSAELVRIGPIDVTQGAVEAAAAVSLRLLAIVLPGIVVVATTDPLDLADALVQHLHVSPRFAYGALAGLRLLPLLSADWHQLRRARRARGLEPGRSPVAVLRFFGSLTFSLLVAAIRRGVRLATAMDARGFDVRTPRTVARPQCFTRADWILVALAFVVVTSATTVSVTAGTWVPAFG